MEHKQHSRIASAVNLIAGLWLIISPYTMAFSNNAMAAGNNIIFGILVALIAIVRLVNPTKLEWLSWVNFVFGLWLVISPFILGYPTMAAYWNNIIVGAIVAIAGSRSAVETRMTTGAGRAAV